MARYEEKDQTLQSKVFCWIITIYPFYYIRTERFFIQQRIVTLLQTNADKF